MPMMMMPTQALVGYGCFSLSAVLAWWSPLLLLLLGLLPSDAAASAGGMDMSFQSIANCTAQCDASTPPHKPPNGALQVRDMPVLFCGTDNATHNTTNFRVSAHYCYALCGVSVFYAGRCGCPNECGAAVGHGFCNVSAASSPPLVSFSSSSCICEPGWGGIDCMSVNCSSNSSGGTVCSGHGSCASGLAVDGVDVCVCDVGYTGAYCDTAALPLPDFIGAKAIPNSPPSFRFASSNASGSQFFNASTLATIRINISEERFRFLVAPPNLYNASFDDGVAWMDFDNGVLQRRGVAVNMKVKGYSSRCDFKKAWNLQLTNPDPAVLDGVLSVGLKTGNDGGDSFMKTFLAASLSAMAGAPGGRAGWCNLYMNSLYMGLFYYDEDVDQPPFLDATFGNSNGTMTKIQDHFVLNYYGNNASNPNYHKGKNEFITFLEDVHTSDWTDFLTLLQYFNNTVAATENTTATNAVLNVDAMLRSLFVEAFLMSTDNFVIGNNYMLYHDTRTAQWTLIEHDWDCVYVAGDDEGVCHNIVDFALYFEDNHANPYYYSPVRTAVFSNPTFVATYLQYAQDVLLCAFGNVTGVGSTDPPLRRRSQMMSPPPPRCPSTTMDTLYTQATMFIYPWYERDVIGQMAIGADPHFFLQVALNTSARLRLRAQQVWNETQQQQPTTTTTTTTMAPSTSSPSPSPSTATPSPTYLSATTPTSALRYGLLGGGAALLVTLLIVIYLVIVRRRNRRMQDSLLLDDDGGGGVGSGAVVMRDR